MSLKSSILQEKVKSLSNEMTQVDAYFKTLLEEFGESKEDYPSPEAFFGVWIEFYDFFMTELQLLEKKKADAEELERQRKAQEALNKLKEKHAMEQFQENTKGLSSSQVFEQTKKEVMRERRARQSIAPSSPTHMTRPSLGTTLKERQNRMFPQDNLGVETFRFQRSEIRESYLSIASEVFSAESDDLSSSDDDIITLKSQRKHQ